MSEKQYRRRIVPNCYVVNPLLYVPNHHHHQNFTPQPILFLDDASKVVVSLAIKHCFRAKDKRAQFSAIKLKLGREILHYQNEANLDSVLHESDRYLFKSGCEVF